MCAAFDQRAAEIRQRIDRVEGAFLFSRSIDQRTYEEQSAKLREDLALAEMQRTEAQVEQIDTEGIVAFAENVLSRAAALWSHASFADRRALQQAIFPDGIPWTATGFGTAVSSSIFSHLRQNLATDQDVASLTGFGESWIAEFSGAIAA